MSAQHVWSGLPGMHCKTCGTESHVESSSCCEDCETTDEGELVSLCMYHQMWADANASCPPGAYKVKEFRSLDAAQSLGINALTSLARRYYAKPGNEAGGALHVVLDDGNIEDSSVKVCLDAAKETGDESAEFIASALMAMTRRQRMAVYRMTHQ